MKNIWIEAMEAHETSYNPSMCAVVSLMDSDYSLSDILECLPEGFQRYSGLIAQHRMNTTTLTEDDYRAIIKHDLHVGVLHDGTMTQTLQKYVPLSHIDWHRMAVMRHPHLPQKYLRENWSNEQLLYVLTEEISPLRYGLRHGKLWTELFCELPSDILQNIPVYQMRNIFFQVESTELMTSSFIQQCERHDGFMDILRDLRLPLEIAGCFQQTMSVSPRAIRNFKDMEKYITIFKHQPTYLLAIAKIDNQYVDNDGMEFLTLLIETIPKGVLFTWLANKKFSIPSPLSWLPYEYVPHRFQDEIKNIPRSPVISALLPWYIEQYNLDLILPNDEIYYNKKSRILTTDIELPISCLKYMCGDINTEAYVEEIDINL